MQRIAHWLRANRGTIFFLIGMLMFRSCLADWNVVPTGSMEPTIRIGDRVLVNKLAYDVHLPLSDISLLHLADPQRGDIVVIDSSAAHERLIKRVIGLPGDSIALRNNVLFVNGRAVSDTPTQVSGIPDDRADPADYAVEQLGQATHLIRLSRFRPSERSNWGPATVPPGQYLMLGDNRDNSMDSRYLGYFPRQQIVGRARYVAFSLNPEHADMPRWQRTASPLDPAR